MVHWFQLENSFVSGLDSTVCFWGQSLQTLGAFFR